MDTAIISKVSQIILENRLGYKLPKQVDGNVNKNDSVQISSAAANASQIAKAIDNADAERSEKLASIRERITNNTYTLSDEMVEKIAQDIAKMFV